MVDCCYGGERARCIKKVALNIFNLQFCFVFFIVFVQIVVGELCAFFTKAEGTQEKTIVTADCCYFNPLLRRIIRFLGEHTVLYHTPVKGHYVCSCYIE